MAARPRTDLERLLPVALFGFVFAVAVRPTVDNDLWWQLATGRWMAEHHAVIGADPFTFGPPVERVPVDWLGHLLLFELWQAGGLTAVSILVGVLAVIGLAFVYAACEGTVVARTAVVAAAATASSIFWSDRAQMFSYALSGVAVWLLWGWHRQPERNRVWWYVPLCFVWAQLHGASLYGPVLAWAFVAGAFIDRLGSAGASGRRPIGKIVGIAALSSVAVVVGPAGVGVFSATIRQLQVNLPGIEEFQPPSLTDPSAWPFFVMLIATVVLLGWSTWIRRRTGKGVEAIDWVCVVITAGVALRVTRAVALFAVVAAPVLCHAIVTISSSAEPEAVPAESGLRRPRPIIAIAAVLAVVLVVGVAARSRLQHAEASVASAYPAGAAAWLHANDPDARIWTAYTWGGYLEWQVPDAKVAIDSRNDLFAERLPRYLETASAGAGWQEDLEANRVDAVAVPPTFPIAAALRASPDWQVGYDDDLAAVFVRVHRK